MHRLTYSWEKKRICVFQTTLYSVAFIQIIKHLVSIAINIKREIFVIDWQFKELASLKYSQNDLKFTTYKKTMENTSYSGVLNIAESDPPPRISSIQFQELEHHTTNWAYSITIQFCQFPEYCELYPPESDGILGIPSDSVLTQLLKIRFGSTFRSHPHAGIPSNSGRNQFPEFYDLDTTETDGIPRNHE